MLLFNLKTVSQSHNYCSMRCPNKSIYNKVKILLLSKTKGEFYSLVKTERDFCYYPLKEKRQI